MKRFSIFALLLVLGVGCGEKPVQKSPAKAEATPKTEPKVAAALKPTKTFINTLGIKFVPVAGTDVQFSMWETRVKDYAAYAAANEGVDERWKEPPYFKERGFKQAATHPVVNVSWKDAQAFCVWLTRKERAEGKITASQSYRLPTDAEWSVAVGLDRESGNTPRAKNMGVKNVYPWGKEWPPPKRCGELLQKSQGGQL